MVQPNAKYDHVFAIIRVDLVHTPDTPADAAIYITKVVRRQDTADYEVQRLNKLNGAKKYVYYWQITRLEKVALDPDL